MKENEKHPFYLQELNSRGSLSPILMAHGLNQNPESLQPIADKFARAGHPVYLFHIPGHARSTEHTQIDASYVIDAFSESYRFVRRESKQKPLFFGYSYGGLLGVLSSLDCEFQGLALLAPALKLRPYTHAIKLVLPWVGRLRSMPLPSSAMQTRYRYHQGGVPTEIYRSFFQLYSRMQNLDRSDLPQVSGRVWMHPKDELIDFSRLNRWLGEYTPWQNRPLSNSQAKQNGYKHLCLDIQTLGESEFLRLTDEVLGFFAESCH